MKIKRPDVFLFVTVTICRFNSWNLIRFQNELSTIFKSEIQQRSNEGLIIIIVKVCRHHVPLLILSHHPSL